MTERYGAENERSAWMRFHTQTAGVSLTPQQPLNNLTRVALQALAAVLGGTQSLHTDAYDEALAVPTAEAALLALRQQQIIAEETGVDATVDPLGGLVVRRGADRRDRAPGLALHRRDRPARRDGRRHHRGLPAARDRRRRLPLPARVRCRRAPGRRGQRLRRRRRGDDRARCSQVPAGSLEAPHGAARAGRAASATPRRSRRRSRGLREAARRPGSSETNLMPHFIRCAAAYATLGEQCGGPARGLRGVPRAGRRLGVRGRLRSRRTRPARETRRDCRALATRPLHWPSRRGSQGRRRHRWPLRGPSGR